MPRILKISFAALFLGLLVTACGGGSSGGTSAAATFPLSTALASLYAKGFQATVTVSGTAEFTSSVPPATYPVTASLTATESALSPGIFAQQAVNKKSSSLSGTINVNGANYVFATVSQEFLSATNALLGFSSPISYCVAASPGQYPDRISIGQAQSVVSYDCYADSTMTTRTGTEKISFIVSTGNSPTTAIFSILENFVDTTGRQTQYTQYNYLIDTSGAISFQSLSFFGFLTSNNGTPNDVQLNFKSQ